MLQRLASSLSSPRVLDSLKRSSVALILRETKKNSEKYEILYIKRADRENDVGFFFF
jgi:hypothetical protein